MNKQTPLSALGVCIAVTSAIPMISMARADEQWSLHFQATAVPQYHPSFNADYTGPLSLSPDPEYRVSYTSTLFIGRRLWKGGELYVNPEVSAGSGLSGTHGVAGYPNGEIYRVDTPSLKFNLSRLYLRQTFALGAGGEELAVEPGKNQLGGTRPSSAVVVTAGEFSLNDFFDNNSYSHDPRSQFLNWGFMDNGAWDYAADTRGYTWGIELELQQPSWTLRLATVLEPKEANQLEFDFNIAHAHGDNAELEYRYASGPHPGVARLLAYLNHAHMGLYQEVLDNPALFDTDITRTRDYRTKYGFGLNLEQDLGAGVGAFMRLGWNNGTTETWAFTEIDRTVSAGLSVSGDAWSRPQDALGVAMMINGLSAEHASYLAIGGQGFMLGDGALSYAPEEIAELYYQYLPLKQLALAADFQYVVHPGYNSARGPVPIVGGRLHIEF